MYQTRPHNIHSLSTFQLIKIFIIATVIVSILGYIDYITGEISIDVLSMLCLIVVTWFSNRIIGTICVIEILSAKVTADYFDNIKIESHLYEWNLLNYFIIYLITCILVVSLKKALSK